MCEAPICRCHERPPVRLEPGKTYVKSNGVKVDILGRRGPYFVGWDNQDTRYKDYNENGTRVGFEATRATDVHLVKEFKEPVVKKCWIVCVRQKHGIETYLFNSKDGLDHWVKGAKWDIIETREVVFEVP